MNNQIKICNGDEHGTLSLSFSNPIFMAAARKPHHHGWHLIEEKMDHQRFGQDFPCNQWNESTFVPLLPCSSVLPPSVN
jgi:hypothetical protein